MTLSIRRLAALLIATALATWLFMDVVQERNNIDTCESLPGDGCPPGKTCRGTYAVLYQPKPGLLGLWGTLHRKEYRCPATVIQTPGASAPAAAPAEPSPAAPAVVDGGKT